MPPQQYKRQHNFAPPAWMTDYVGPSEYATNQANQAKSRAMMEQLTREEAFAQQLTEAMAQQSQQGQPAPDLDAMISMGLAAANQTGNFDKALSYAQADSQLQRQRLADQKVSAPTLKKTPTGALAAFDKVTGEFIKEVLPAAPKAAKSSSKSYKPIAMINKDGDRRVAKSDEEYVALFESGYDKAGSKSQGGNTDNSLINAITGRSPQPEAKSIENLYPIRNKKTGETRWVTKEELEQLTK